MRWREEDDRRDGRGREGRREGMVKRGRHLVVKPL
jgi:hypothetical protein